MTVPAPSSPSPFIVGLTGGVGSGKSTVAGIFVELGAKLIDTDAIAHALTGAGGKAMPALIAEFGEEIAAADGSLARDRMRRLVFADLTQKERLENILHPMIRAEAAELLYALARANDVPYVLYAIPLLVESGGRRVYGLDRVLVVDCQEETQCKRVMRRSHLSEEEARAILKNQVSRAERLAIADDLLDNSGEEAALIPAVRALHARYLRLAREKNSDVG